jgi:phosphatidate cytidylyltransferase
MIVMSVYGDLYFSLVKRKNNIKDFSNVFPGHGGFLDRCDSIIFTVLFYFSVTLVISTISTIIYPDVNTIFNNSYFFNI